MSKITVKELEQHIRQGEVDTVVTAFPDLYGRLLGKRITGHYFLDSVLSDGMHACDYLLACDIEMDPVPGYAFTSWEKGYGDFHCVPDLNTIRLTPWIDKTAFVICDILDSSHELLSVAPRSILKKQLARAREKGFLVKGASELEFFLFKDSFEAARAKGYADLETYGWYIEDYHVLQSTKEEWFMRAVRNGMDRAGVPIEFSKGEWGPGQHEINLAYAEMLEMADRHSLYKHGVKEIAALNDVSVTFMAKWHHAHAGNSCHIHASLWDEDSGSSAFFDASAAEGMSQTLRHWIGGQLAHANELTMFLAPYVNSYKRYQNGSFAPTAVTYSVDNRTSGFRLVGQGPSLRVENRIPGADCNPYLAFAATLAAGLDGIERSLDPGVPFVGDAYAADLPSIPSNLRDAVESWEGSDFVRESFGKDVAGHYGHMGRTELRKFDEIVTDAERLRGFERG